MLCLTMVAVGLLTTWFFEIEYTKCQLVKVILWNNETKIWSSLTKQHVIGGSNMPFKGTVELSIFMAAFMLNSLISFSAVKVLIKKTPWSMYVSANILPLSFCSISFTLILAPEIWNSVNYSFSSL